jgi:hypothetical protein
LAHHREDPSRDYSGFGRLRIWMAISGLLLQQAIEEAGVELACLKIRVIQYAPE